MIKIIDLNYLGRPHCIAAFVIETDEGPVLVETGPHSTFSNLEAGLKTCGYALTDLRHVLLTHIHLDHAGSAWALAAQGATVYLHPFGYRHMADPSKLYASAKRIYQDDMDRLWGELRPIPETQLRIMEHGDALSIGGRRFIAHHTPGHAVHHIAWQVDDNLFTGDVAGVLVEGVQIQPPCPPPDINLEDWEASLRLIKALDVKRLYLTHFGIVSDVDTHLDTLQARFREWAEWIRPRWEAGQSSEEIIPAFQKFTEGQLRAAGANNVQLTQYDAANPAWMSVVGLMRYWKKRSE